MFSFSEYANQRFHEDIPDSVQKWQAERRAAAQAREQERLKAQWDSERKVAAQVPSTSSVPETPKMPPDVPNAEGGGMLSPEEWERLNIRANIGTDRNNRMVALADKINNLSPEEWEAYKAKHFNNLFPRRPGLLKRMGNWFKR